MSRFEDRLLADLLADHGHRLLPASVEGGQERTGGRVRRIPRPVALVAAGVLVAGVVGVSLSTTGPAAYAVQTHADGSVTVSLRDVSALVPANDELRRAGAHVVVVPMTEDCAPVAEADYYAGDDWDPPRRGQDGSATVGAVPQGYTVLLALDTYPGGEGGLSFTAPLRDPAPDCLLSPLRDEDRSS